MKQKFRNILKLFTLGTVFMLGSCAEERYYDAVSNKSNINIRKVSMKDIQLRSNFKLMEAVSKVKQKSSLVENALGRIVYDSINNFYFDDENGTLIEKDGKDAYTFPIKRISGNEAKLENIVFNKNVFNEYDTYIVKYDFTEAALAQMSNQDIELNASQNTDYTQVAGRINTDCITIYLSACSGDPYDCHGTECGYYEVQFCEGSGGTLNDGGNSTGDATTSNGNPILTIPTPGGGGAGPKPCKKIKNQKDTYPGLQQALIDLETTKTQNHENGIFINSNSPNVQNLPTSTVQGAAVGMPNPATGVKYKVAGHTHDAVGPVGTGTYSIYSWGDLSRLASLYKANQIDNDFFTLYLATADNTRYAITIDFSFGFADYFDYTTDPYNPQNSNYFNMEKYEKLNKKEKEYYKDEAVGGSDKIGLATNPADDLKIFLSMLKDLKLEVSLFEVDPTYTIYEKLTLTASGTVQKGEPCN
jgi:hypothetical protein